MHAMHNSRDIVGVGTQVPSLSKHALHGIGAIIKARCRDWASGPNLDISVDFSFIRNGIF